MADENRTETTSTTSTAAPAAPVAKPATRKRAARSTATTPARSPSAASFEPTDMVDPSKTTAKATVDFSHGTAFVEKGRNVPDDVLATLSHGDLVRLEKVAGVIEVSRRG